MEDYYNNCINAIYDKIHFHKRKLEYNNPDNKFKIPIIFVHKGNLPYCTIFADLNQMNTDFKYHIVYSIRGKLKSSIDDIKNASQSDDYLSYDVLKQNNPDLFI